MTTSPRTTRRQAERRRRKAETAAARAADRAQVAEIGDAPTEPAFLFGFAVPHAKLAVARFWIFGLLAVDAFLQLSHAPRYGAGGFNVAHAGFLDGIAPGRIAVGVLYVALVYLFAATALGVGSRITVGIAAVVYAWIYLSSQLDSYQHHYLIALLLVLATQVPWFAPAGTTGADAARPVRSWALRVILIQLGIVYLWAAIAKLDTSWLDGSALRAQLAPGGVRSLIEATIGFRATAVLIVATELFLAVAIWVRPLWKIAAPLGVAMHVGIAFTNLEIGVFSWLMVALYLLLIPDRWVVRAWHAEAAWSPASLAERLLRRRPALVGALAAAGIALPVVSGAPFDGAVAAAVVAGAIVVAVDCVRLRRRVPRVTAAAAPMLTAVLVAVLAATTAVVADYYRFWGGASRRLRDVDTARHAYGRMVELAPDEPGGHYQLGKLLLATGAALDEARGLAELHRAQALEPGRARAFTAEARYLASAGADRRDAALAAARKAVAAEPANTEAAALAAAIERGTAPAPAPDDEPAP